MNNDWCISTWLNNEYNSRRKLKEPFFAHACWRVHSVAVVDCQSSSKCSFLQLNVISIMISCMDFLQFKYVMKHVTDSTNDFMSRPKLGQGSRPSHHHDSAAITPCDVSRSDYTTFKLVGSLSHYWLYYILNPYLPVAAVRREVWGHFEP